MTIKPLLFQNYLTVIKNSVNSTVFRNFYIEENGNIKDILENGNLSCAIFVSNILHMFSGIHKLIDNPHVTVSSTLRDMVQNNWFEISELKIGAVLHWEAVDFGTSGMHEHIGFYIGDNLAISNNSKLGFPTVHDFEFDGTRKIRKILWHKALDL